MGWIILIAAAGLVGGLLIHNELKLKKGFKKEKPVTLNQIIKKEYNLPDNYVVPAERMGAEPELDLSYSKLHAKTAAFSVIGETAWYGGEILSNIMAVDNNMYEAISHITGKQLDSLSDLHSATDTWAQSFLGGMDDGVITSLQGHVAEQIVADHLKEAGHNVMMPETANQQGYDMIVDGMPINIKNVSDMNTINEHFDKNPDIGVITNADVSGLPDKHLDFDPSNSIDQLPDFSHNINENLLIVDHGLDHDAVINQTESATDAITGNVDAHFPYITALISATREISIIRKGHTTLETSVKNVALDLAGTGGGALVGAKGGALAGSIFGPIGAAVGAIGGAFLGGLFGRKFTDDIKMKKFKEAGEKYKRDLDRYNCLVSAYPAEYRKYKGVVTGAETKRLQAHSFDAKTAIEQAVESYRVIASENLNLTNSCLLELLREALGKLNNEMTINEKELHKLPFISRYIVLSGGAVELVNKKRLILRKTEMLKEMVKRVNNVDDKATQTQRTALCLEALCLAGFDEIAREHIKKNKIIGDKNREDLLGLINNQKNKLAAERVKAIKNINESLNEWVKKQMDMMTAMIGSLKNTQSEFKDEAGKLGFIKG